MQNKTDGQKLLFTHDLILNRRHEMEDLKLRTVACKMAEEPFSLWTWIFISLRLHSGLLPLESTVHKWKYSDLYFSIIKISCCSLKAQPSCQNKMLATFQQIIDMLKYAHIKCAISIFLQHVQHHGHITCVWSDFHIRRLRDLQAYQNRYFKPKLNIFLILTM